MIQDSRVKKAVTVFGNELEEQDNLVIGLLPELKKMLPEIDFQIADPTENLEPVSDPWIILDVGMGIEEVVVLEDLNQLDYVKGQSVHDFDVYMELRLRDKLGELPKLQIIIVPYDFEKARAMKEIERVLC